MKKTALALLIYSMPILLNAQEMNDDPARPALGATGQIFTLKLTPQSRKLEVAFAGSPAVTLDPERITILGKVYSAKGEPKALRIQSSSGHFEVMDPIESSSSVEFEVKDRVSKKTETLRIKPKP